MGLLDKIKEDAKNSGGNKGKFFYVKDGDKRRVRFLQDMDDGFEVTFHDSFEANINIPCQEIFGRTCPYCDEEGLRTRTMYAWSVWDYDAKEVKILMYAMNNCSPIGAIAAAYETYGTLTDRDFVITCTGKQKDKTMSVMPMDKEKFRNAKAKPYSKKAFLEILDKAYPDEYSDENDEPKMKKKSAVKSKKRSDDEDTDLPFTTPKDYQLMSAKDLYNLCEERGIEAEPKNPKQYYIDLLEDDDEQNESKADDDDWDDEDDDLQLTKYNDMSAKELYKLCVERKIEAQPKKSEKYYINLLEEDDKAHDDWEDDDEESDDDDDDWE